MVLIFLMYNCIIVFKCLESNKIDSDSDSDSVIYIALSVQNI